MKFFVVTIDTEADCSADWTGADPESYRNLHELRKRLLPALGAVGAPGTLLLSPDVIEREEPGGICDALRRDSGWELGTHLHGEFVEPQRKYSSHAGVLLDEFQCGYSQELEFAKMKTLTELFERRFGFFPASFRAGRFGAGPGTFEACLKLGYEVDSSVVPGAVFREGDAVADFTGFDAAPRIVASNGRTLMEIPITVKPGRFNFRTGGKAAQKGGTESGAPGTAASGKRVSETSAGSATAKHGPFLRRHLPVPVKSFVLNMTGPLHKPLWLRPSYSSAGQMKSVLTWLVKHEESRPVVANMMFHSNELLAGASPYNATDGDVVAFMGRLSATLDNARDLGFEFTTLAEAARAVKRIL